SAGCILPAYATVSGVRGRGLTFQIAVHILLIEASSHSGPGHWAGPGPEPKERAVTSIFDPAVPAGAFDAFVDDAARASRAQRAWSPDDGPLPALYISHGAPPLFDDAPWIRELFAWAQQMPKPRAILIVSGCRQITLTSRDRRVMMWYGHCRGDRGVSGGKVPGI